MVLDKTVPNIGEFTKIPLNLFFMVGICIRRWKPDEKPRRLQLFFILLLIFHVALDCTAILAYLIFVPLETSLEKTAYIIYTTFAGNSILKFVCTLLNVNKLRKILKNIEEYYPRTVAEREAYKLDDHLQSIRKYNRGLSIYHFCVTTMFNLFPLVRCFTLYYQSENGLFLYELPFPMIYTFNSKKPWGYAFAYLTQCTGSYSASCMFLGSDLLLITCVQLINMNFRYLTKRISEFQSVGSKRDCEILKSYVIYHNHILETIQQVDEVFSFSIFINFMGTVVIMCLIAFQLLVGTDFMDLIKFLSFLVSVITHVFFISIFGTEMTTLSFRVSETFMFHSWYDAHAEYRRALHLCIARSQKPVYLNAFKFFNVSMETFKSLLSVSYQFFTLIKTSYVDE